MSIIKLPDDTANGLYIGFNPDADRIARGAKITTCSRCGKLTGHWPRDSIGHEIVCMPCAAEVPAIREHIDRLAKERGN